MLRTRTLVGVLAFALLLAMCSARECHVDQKNGKDSAQCGSTAAPCASILYAVSSTGVGDVILLAAGTYGGAKNVPIMIGSYGVNNIQSGIYCIFTRSHLRQYFHLQFLTHLSF